jgi:predicted nucleic acid-binding protein
VPTINSVKLSDPSTSLLPGCGQNLSLESTRPLEDNALRAMDALHIACALEWRAELFVSSDKQQIMAAEKSGLITKLI